MSPNHALPLEPEQLDELLSAALDGEFEAAARDLGLSVEDADERIRATPGADERRIALAEARDLLGVATPMDDLLAARLRAKAVRAAEIEHTAHADDRRRRRNRILLSAGGIAAAIAALVAVANGVHGFHPDSYASSSKRVSAPATTATRSLVSPTHTGSGAAATALGSFADARSLALAAVRSDAATRAFGDDRLKQEAGPEFGTKTGTSDDAAPTTAAATTTQNGTAKSTNKADAPTARAAESQTQYDAVGRSAATCGIPPGVPAAATPVLRASATLAGQPVVVLVFSNATERVVVIEDTNCKLVNLQMFP